MTRIAGLLFTLLLFSGLSAAETDTVHSRYVNDDFVITIKKPAAYNSLKKYIHVYITDGTLGIGEYILGKNKNWSARIPPNCIIIAISHMGSWHDKRSRDFIPSDISKNEEPDFGKADLFYLFMQKELIPSIEKKLPNRKQRAFIGHSFGGLFCLYTLFKEDKLFDRHFAISPSAWANYYELDKIEEAYFAKHKSLRASVNIYAGGLEFLNKVLASSRAFYKTLQERKYVGLAISKEEIGGANHYSVRKPAVDRIFALLKD
jgi:predicted alpha/beta superfamily hydrolase